MDRKVVVVEATYKSVWNDGFGARGWKLNDSIGDPVVIANTSETGMKIPTSVFVHDIVDHHLSGLKLSGHRNEAIALNLLYERTGSDPTPDYEQMIEEDLMIGRVNGELLIDFLPDNLKGLIPQKIRNSNKLSIGYLLGSLGREPLKRVLVRHFYDISEKGRGGAIESWNNTGLDFNKRKEIGMGIQRLLSKADKYFEECGSDVLRANFLIANNNCAMEIDNEVVSYFREYY